MTLAFVAVVAAKCLAQVVLALEQIDCAVGVVPGGSVPGGAGARDALCARPADLVVIEDARARPAPSVAVAGVTVDAAALTAALRATATHAGTPILVIGTEPFGSAGRLAALEAGATDVMLAPLDPLDLRTRLRNLVALSTARAERDRHRAERDRAEAGAGARAAADVGAGEREVIRRLMLAAESRDDQTGGHLARVAGCVIALAEGLGLSPREADDIALASTMHDIGKIGMPDAILLKPGPLSEGEREQMKQHALRGHQVLQGSSSRMLRLASEIALTHHERWDGTGYPQGLRETQIPLSGRIVAVADVFDALISARAYKPAWPLARARRYVEEEAGRHFDPACVAAFLSRWADVVALVEAMPR